MGVGRQYLPRSWFCPSLTAESPHELPVARTAPAFALQMLEPLGLSMTWGKDRGTLVTVGDGGRSSNLLFLKMAHTGDTFLFREWGNSLIYPPFCSSQMLLPCFSSGSVLVALGVSVPAEQGRRGGVPPNNKQSLCLKSQPLNPALDKVLYESCCILKCCRAVKLALLLQSPAVCLLLIRNII